MRHLTVIAFILLVVCHFEMVSQSCLPDGITFNTQSQIDSFQINHPNCTEIEGDVVINGIGISTLNGLNVLTSIGGDLTVGGGNSILTNLTGLNNLTSVGGKLLIYHNTAMTSLTGLEDLTYIGGHLNISYNYFANLSGLDNLTSIGGTLWIYFNWDLINLTGLNSLDSIGGDLNIHTHNDLTSLTGLDNLSYIGDDLIVDNNNGLTTLIGLDGITSVPGYMSLYGNDGLISLSGLDNLTSIGGHLSISQNDVLTSTASLEHLILISGDIWMHDNYSLASLTGLDNIVSDSITGLHIYNNTSLSLCDVQSICDYLVSPNGEVEIYNNAPGCNSHEEVEEACMVGIKEQLSASQLSAYPNPFTTSTTIEYELKEISNIQFIIYNVIGEVVYMGEDRMPQGKHIFTWTADRLPDGLYYAVLRSEEVVSVVKMVKQ